MKVAKPPMIKNLEFLALQIYDNKSYAIKNTIVYIVELSLCAEIAMKC